MKGSVLQRIEEVQRLTRDYASYTRRRSGLGNVLGGMITLIVTVLLLLSTPNHLLALAAPGLTLIWLVGKELLRTFLYVPFGKATERWSAPLQRYQLLRACLGILLLTGIMLTVIVHQRLAFQHWWPLLVFLLVTPWIAWRYLRSWIEYLLGLFLLLASALTSIGQSGEVRFTLFVAFLLALLGILLGLAEHLRFRLLVDEMRGRHRDMLSQCLLHPMVGMAPADRSVQPSWLSPWSFQALPRGFFPSMVAIGGCMLLHLLQVLALLHPIAVFPPPMMLLMLLCVEEALSTRVVPAYAGQGGRR
jgi:hypothetical protein